MMCNAIPAFPNRIERAYYDSFWLVIRTLHHGDRNPRNLNIFRSATLHKKYSNFKNSQRSEKIKCRFGL